MPLVKLALLVLATSKLGIHVLGDPQDSVTQSMLQACPPVVKWMSPASRSVQAELSAYRARCLDGITILRAYVPPTRQYQITDSAQCSADDFWARMQPGLSGIQPSSVDWLEGPNEGEMLPQWHHNLQAAMWYASFWSRLADRMNAAGFHPLVGSIAVGNPALAGESPGCGVNCFKPISDTMKLKGYRWGWSYHGYSANLASIGEEIWYSLRYRQIRDQCGLAGIPLVVTEAGQDIPTGWQGRGTTPTQYMNWLNQFDAWMQQDSEVLGATIFGVGDRGQWRDFDLSPIATQLINRWYSNTCH